MTAQITLHSLEAISAREFDGLCEVLIDCVEGGASVSFMSPMTRFKAESFWREVSASVSRGERLLITAQDASGVIAGTVQLVFAQAENQPHRADVAKMLVHRRFRKAGVGAALLAAAESHAMRCARTLLVLDTVTGAEGARLYARHGWQRCGEIPHYAYWPDGRPCPTTIYYKELAR